MKEFKIDLEDQMVFIRGNELNVSYGKTSGIITVTDGDQEVSPILAMFKTWNHWYLVSVKKENA